MWSKMPSQLEGDMIKKAIEFTGNAELYGSWMIKVLSAWPLSCEHNLSNEDQNRLAWIGHAATTLAIGSPEYITRKAWGFLSQTQQDEANQKARDAVAMWCNERNGISDDQMLLAI